MDTLDGFTKSTIQGSNKQWMLLVWTWFLGLILETSTIKKGFWVLSWAYHIVN